MANWYKLDNAAKIFPFIYSPKDTNSFRLSCVFKEPINVLYLMPALKKALKRFPTFCVRLKNGIFWQYFDHNNSTPIIKKENPNLCLSVHPKKNNGFLFTLSHNEKRLILEVFHSLSDGAGALEFFKCICYYYLIECGHEICNNGEVLTDEYEKLASEKEDSFSWSYDKRVKPHEGEENAYQLKGHSYPDVFAGIIHVVTPLDKLKEVSRRYEATITQYLSGCVLKAIYDIYYSRENKPKRPVALFLPVNARKFFDSQSMRNFALYVRVHTRYEGEDVTLKSMIKLVKETLDIELNKERLATRISYNVRFEKYWFIRILPLFLKKIGMKIGYHVQGTDANTISFSNLGKVELPKDMEKYIEQFEFLIPPNHKLPYSMGGVSYNNKFVLSFGCRYIERYFIRHIVDQLVRDGLQIEVQTNDLEVE